MILLIKLILLFVTLISGQKHLELGKPNVNQNEIDVPALFNRNSIKFEEIQQVKFNFKSMTVRLKDSVDFFFKGDQTVIVQVGQVVADGQTFLLKAKIPFNVNLLESITIDLLDQSLTNHINFSLLGNIS